MNDVGRAYGGVLQLIEEVLAVLSAPELAQSQTADNWDQHEPNAEVLQSNVLSLTNRHHWVVTGKREMVLVLYTLRFSVAAQELW